jgi:transcriptional regulator with AAA-type ATPase domain
VGQPAPACPAEILHSCLIEPRHAVPLEAATLGDRQRLGILLEGCALDAHLALIGRRPVAGWQGARISASGRLVAVAVEADGRDHGEGRWGNVRVSEPPPEPLGETRRAAPPETPRDRAVLLLRRLFGSEDVPGRGEGRRIARELARRWALYLTPTGADELVGDVLRAAAFLWLDRFAAYRESLAAQIGNGRESRLQVAGPAAFRRQVLRHARALPELHALLRGAQAALLWTGEAPQEVREPRPGSWRSHATGEQAARDRRQRDRIAPAVARLDRLVALHRAGRWRAAAGEADRLRREDRMEGVELELARLAADAHLQLRQWRGAATWAAFAIAHGSASPSVARLLAAWVAAASPGPASPPGGVEGSDAALAWAADAAPAPPAATSVEPLLLWARIEVGRDAVAVIARLGAALRLRSRHGSFERGRLWLELGRARLAVGHERAAERAFAHAHRHLRRGDGVVELWRATAALAGARLRRGDLEGLDDAVASLGDQARAGADRGREIAAAILGLRLDLARGRDHRAAAAAIAVLDRLPRGRRDPVAIEVASLRAMAERRLGAGAASPAFGVAPPRPAEPLAASRVPARAELRGAIVGRSPVLIDALVRIDRLARGEVPVLLFGETGTGKELAAKRLHAGSPRRQRAFLAVNCAALSESLLLSELFGHARGAFTGADREHAGVFEAAHGGVVFLDEIGDLPIGAQGALLRVLQDGEVRRLGESRPRRVDVRVVAATHRDLVAQVDGGAFRQDLYYRLGVATVRLPPLRERGEDVLLLARQFLAEHGGGLALAADAEQLLLACSWPGNVRELRSVIQVAAAVHDGDGPLHARDLEVSPAPRPPASYHAALDAERRRLLEGALAAASGRRAEAARRLGITPQAISYLVRRLGLGMRVVEREDAEETIYCRPARHKMSGRQRPPTRP